MVARVGVGEDTAARIWFDHGLKPWTLDTFKPATIPLFELRETGAASLASSADRELREWAPGP